MVTRQQQVVVERRTEKVGRPKTDGSAMIIFCTVHTAYKLYKPSRRYAAGLRDALFYPGTFGGTYPQTSKIPPTPRIFGHACREAKNNVNTRLTSIVGSEGQENIYLLPVCLAYIAIKVIRLFRSMQTRSHTQYRIATRTR